MKKLEKMSYSKLKERNIRKKKEKEWKNKKKQKQKKIKIKKIINQTKVIISKLR